MYNHSHIRHFSSVFVSLRDFELKTQNSSENIASRQFRYIYVNGIYPDDWKMAKFLPIFKNDKKSHIINYRPISITSSVAKVF